MRTWDDKGNVHINTFWQNSVTFYPSTTDLGTDFEWSVSAGKNPLFIYSWVTTDDLKKQLLDDLAVYKKANLEYALKVEPSIFTKTTDTDLDKLNSDIEVTEINNDTSDKYNRTYHIYLSNPKANFEAGKSITTLTVSASGFSLPENIKNYEDDYNNLFTEGNYNGITPKYDFPIVDPSTNKLVFEANTNIKDAVTSNKDLQNALISTSPIETNVYKIDNGNKTPVRAGIILLDGSYWL